MRYPSLLDVIRLHDRYVQMFGGSLGIRDSNLLDSAVSRCQASFGGEDLYDTVFDKAAAMFHGILFDHPFGDGNKRTALFSAVRFLFINGHEFVATNLEAEEFPIIVEKTRPPISEIAKWFKSHCRKIKKGKTK